MASAHLSETAAKAIRAYGGSALWRAAKHVQAVVSVSGLAFRLKRRPFFRHARVRATIHRPFAVLAPIGRNPGLAGVLDGPHVRLEDEDGRVVAERRDARGAFRLGRRTLYWDDLDMAYFANYAFWNYFALPALLMRDDIAWTELAPGRLTARFPPNIPTPCAIQRFRFDPQTGRLMQHDYTAAIISRLATAAHVVLEHAVNADGVPYPSARRVTPRGPGGVPMPGPILIHIAVHDFRLT